jgi:hypothetical protein
VRPVIGPLSRNTWVAHVALVLAGAIAAALLAVLPEGDPRRKIVSTVLTVLVPILIIQVMVESRLSGAPVAYRIPYAISAAAAILMIVAQSMRGPVVTPSSEISGLLFTIAIIVLAFQVLRLPRSPEV